MLGFAPISALPLSALKAPLVVILTFDYGGVGGEKRRKKRKLEKTAQEELNELLELSIFSKESSPVTAKGKTPSSVTPNPPFFDDEEDLEMLFLACH